MVSISQSLFHRAPVCQVEISSNADLWSLGIVAWSLFEESRAALWTVDPKKLVSDTLVQSWSKVQAHVRGRLQRRMTGRCRATCRDFVLGCLQLQNQRYSLTQLRLVVERGMAT